MQPTLDAIIDKAADIIEQPQSWGRGQDRRASQGSPCGSRFCLRGALYEASRQCMSAAGERGNPIFTAYDNAENAVSEEINRSYPNHGFGSRWSVIRWNDEQRDKRKVIRVLRRTARRLRAGLA